MIYFDFPLLTKMSHVVLQFIYFIFYLQRQSDAQ